MKERIFTQSDPTNAQTDQARRRAAKIILDCDIFMMVAVSKKGRAAFMYSGNLQELIDMRNAIENKLVDAITDYVLEESAGDPEVMKRLLNHIAELGERGANPGT